jgi:hypothetical protein
MLLITANKTVTVAIGCLFVVVSFFLFVATRKALTQEIIVTDKGLKASFPSHTEVPWEQIQGFSTGDSIFKSRFLKVCLADGKTVEVKRFWGALTPKYRNFILLNVYIFSETSEELAKHFNHIRLNKRKLVKAATNKAFKGADT